MAVQPRAKKDGQVLSIADVAAALDMPQTTIQNIEQRALRKCRDYLARRGIAISDLIDDTAMPLELDTRKAEARFDAAADLERT